MYMYQVSNRPDKMAQKMRPKTEGGMGSDENTAAYRRIVKPDKHGWRERIKKRKSVKMGVVLLNAANLRATILTQITFRDFCLSKGGHPLRDLAKNAGDQRQAIDIKQFFTDNMRRRSGKTVSTW